MLCPQELVKTAAVLRDRAANEPLASCAQDLLNLAEEYEEQALVIQQKNLPCDPTLVVDLPA